MKNEATFKEQLDSIINEHLGDENFTVAELSKLLGCSRTQLYRNIKSTTELAPSSYIMELRLIRAGDLLINAQATDTVASVAYSVGFKDAAYFSRAFKRRFGMTAVEYRQNGRSKT
jgi:AraC-like DNA-binding protein